MNDSFLATFQPSMTCRLLLGLADSLCLISWRPVYHFCAAREGWYWMREKAFKLGTKKEDTTLTLDKWLHCPFEYPEQVVLQHLIVPCMAMAHTLEATTTTSS